MIANISVIVICVEANIYLLSYDLHGCTLIENFNFCAVLSSCTINLPQFMMEADRFWICCGLIIVKGLKYNLNYFLVVEEEAFILVVNNKKIFRNADSRHRFILRLSLNQTRFWL